MEHGTENGKQVVKADIAIRSGYWHGRLVSVVFIYKFLIEATHFAESCECHDHLDFDTGSVAADVDPALRRPVLDRRAYDHDQPDHGERVCINLALRDGSFAQSDRINWWAILRIELRAWRRGSWFSRRACGKLWS